MGVVGALVCSLLSQQAAFGADGGTATAAIRGTVNEVIRILENDDLKGPERASERREQIVTIVKARFDFKEMSKRTLGRHWRKLNDDQRREFVRLFTALLATSYAKKMDGYSDERVEYLSERTKKNFAEVKTKVRSGKVEIPLDYRLLKNSDDWRVYDVVVDGVSLVRNYRGQFSKVIKSSSYDDLVVTLREKTSPSRAP